MAEFSEIYQASLRPIPPNKPLPDETGFHDYFSPPPVGQSYNDPNYNYYYYPPAPQPFPPPPPVLTFPPPPPELDLLPFYPPPPMVRSSRAEAPNSNEISQPMVNFMVYCSLLFVALLLLSLTMMIAYAISVVPDQWTEEQYLGFLTRPAEDADHFARGAVEATTPPSGSQATQSRQQSEGSTKVERTD